MVKKIQLKLQKYRSHKTGLPPGSLVYVGHELSQSPSTLNLARFDADSFEISELTVQQLRKIDLASDSTYWLILKGVHDVEKVKEIGDFFRIDKLMLEDILNTNQRPKIEFDSQHQMVVLKDFHITNEHQISSNQVSIILGKNYVISFSEDSQALMDIVLDRIENSAWRKNDRKADYLTYALIDIIVDGYFKILEYFNDEIEELEDQIYQSFEKDILQRLQELRRAIILFKRAVLPLREAVMLIRKPDNKFIKEGTYPFLKDLEDHVLQVNESIDVLKEMINGLHETYFTKSSEKMNETMKVLTVISTIFIPLTFIAGIYGMNFQFMPELGWKFGYFIVLGIMLAIAVGMVIFFKRRKWF